jgi:nitroreductase
MGGALPELNLPLPGTEPNAFIVICSDKEGRYVDIDLGIATQTILLRAVEMGLNGLCIAAFDQDAVQTKLQLSLPPQLIIAIGRSTEHIEVVDISTGESQTYYRKNGTHFVPKLRTEDLILK